MSSSLETAPSQPREPLMRVNVPSRNGQTNSGNRRSSLFDHIVSGVAGASEAGNDPQREALLTLKNIVRAETASIEYRHLAEEDVVLREYIQNLMASTRKLEINDASRR
ncbi:hypothetical protein HK405_014047 [Cladochytrium tenue]|nr:hypothetical protein HK405_014047 [Cladochytrium tenue]